MALDAAKSSAAAESSAASNTAQQQLQEQWREWQAEKAALQAAARDAAVKADAEALAAQQRWDREKGDLQKVPLQCPVFLVVRPGCSHFNHSCQPSSAILKGLAVGWPHQ